MALHNLYGPTEAAIEVSYYTISEDIPPIIPIGQPVWNTVLYVFDKEMKPVPLGVPGEIWIGGEQVARGYLNRAELTGERFVSDPYVPGGRLYRTGD
ncbi:AMP-binding protein, partial [Olivibacter sp. CPCC 100613]|uniref:AMP-binding protein n=1 Tax=Olivibacter sp. CPCC 100613 TaxID=3079931 RepID=UPI003FA55A52